MHLHFKNKFVNAVQSNNRIYSENHTKRKYALWAKNVGLVNVIVSGTIFI
jgi:hypothetical protein